MGAVEIPDPATPYAVALFPNSAKAGDTTYEFTVTYADAQSKIDLTSLGSGNVTITGPNGYSQNATPLSNTGAGNSVMVTYSILAPMQASSASSTVRITACTPSASMPAR